MDIQVDLLRKRLADRKLTIELSERAKEALAVEGFDPVYGARPLARVIQTEVRDPLTDEILFGKLENGGTVDIGLDAENDKLVFTFRT